MGEPRTIEEAVAARKVAEAAGDTLAWQRARNAEIVLRENAVAWDTTRHPRDRHGRFIDVLAKLGASPSEPGRHNHATHVYRQPGKVGSWVEPEVGGGGHYRVYYQRPSGEITYTRAASEDDAFSKLHDIRKQRSTEGMADPGVGMPSMAWVNELIEGHPKQSDEPEFVYEARMVDSLPQRMKHEVLFRARERYKPVDYIVAGAKRWRKDHGLPEPKVNPLTVRAPLDKADRVARAFEGAQDMADEPRVKQAFADFKRQNAEMWEFATKPVSEGGMGIKVDFIPSGQEAYQSAREQADDLRDNRHIFTESGLGGVHTLMSTEEYDRFRAVHDIFGHAGVGGGFDRHGEYEAWLEHMTMYTGPGRDAMSSEYHGVNTAMWAGAPGTPGTGRSLLLPDNLIRDPWDDEGNLVREAKTEDVVEHFIRKIGLSDDFAARYERSPWHQTRSVLEARLAAAVQARKAAQESGDTVQWSRARAEEIVLREAFNMVNWRETLHPRTRSGQFRDKLGAAPVPKARTGRQIARVSDQSQRRVEPPQRQERSAPGKDHYPRHRLRPHEVVDRSEKKTREMVDRAEHATHNVQEERQIRKQIAALKPGEKTEFPGGVVVTRAEAALGRQYDVHDDGATSRGMRRVIGLRDAGREAYERHHKAVSGMADPGTVTKGPEATRYERDFEPKGRRVGKAKERYRNSRERIDNEGETVDRLYPPGAVSDVGYTGGLEAVGNSQVPGVSHVAKFSAERIADFEHFLGAPAHEAGAHAASGSHGVEQVVGGHGHAASHAGETVGQVSSVAHDLPTRVHGAADTLHGMADPGTATHFKTTAADLLSQAAPHVGTGRNRAALGNAARIVSQMMGDDTIRGAGRVAGHVVKHLVQSAHDEARAARIAALASGDTTAWTRARAIEEAARERLVALEAADPDPFDAVSHPRDRRGRFVATMFHGTSVKNATAILRSGGLKPDVDTQRIWLTSSMREAGAYSTGRAGAKRPVVVSAKVTLDRPFVFDRTHPQSEDYFQRRLADAGIAPGTVFWDDALKRKGYDGIVYLKLDTAGRPFTDVEVFDPKSVKLVKDGLSEAYDALKHPRDRRGQFRDTPDAVADMPGAIKALMRHEFHGRDKEPQWTTPTKLGVTPYHKTRDPSYPRRTYADAKAMFDDDQWKPTFEQFESDAKALAKTHEVKLKGMARNVGVFEGEYEPSYAITAVGAPGKVRAFNEALGRKWNQDAVVSFRREKTGSDAEAWITGIEHPDQFYAALKAKLGDEAGASFDAKGVRVFIYGGDKASMEAVRDVVNHSGHGHSAKGMSDPGTRPRVKIYRGTGDYSELKAPATQGVS